MESLTDEERLEYTHAEFALSQAYNKAKEIVIELNELLNRVDTKWEKIKQMHAKNSPAMCDRISVLSRKRVYSDMKPVQAIVVSRMGK